MSRAPHGSCVGTSANARRSRRWSARKSLPVTGQRPRSRAVARRCEPGSAVVWWSAGGKAGGAAGEPGRGQGVADSEEKEVPGHWVGCPREGPERGYAAPSEAIGPRWVDAWYWRPSLSQSARPVALARRARAEFITELEAWGPCAPREADPTASWTAPTAARCDARGWRGRPCPAGGYPGVEA